jgi:hypothetical protein
LSPQNEGSATQDLLFVSDDKQLFYFTERSKGSKKEKSQDTIIFNVLDTLKCHKGDVVPITSTIYLAANKESESFEIQDPNTQFLLRYLFSRPTRAQPRNIRNDGK